MDTIRALKVSRAVQFLLLMLLFVMLVFGMTSTDPGICTGILVTTTLLLAVYAANAIVSLRAFSGKPMMKWHFRRMLAMSAFVVLLLLAVVGVNAVGMTNQRLQSVQAANRVLCMVLAYIFLAYVPLRLATSCWSDVPSLRAAGMWPGGLLPSWGDCPR